MHHTARSDVGRVRSNNEDAYSCAPDIGLFIIADGLGGHDDGEIASRLAVDTARAFVERAADPGGAVETVALRQALLEAHARVLAENADRLGTAAMGTTLTAVAVSQGRLNFAHAGDSRAYVVHATGSTAQITRDHTLAQKMRDDGEHPARISEWEHSTLLQAVGLEGEFEPDTGTVPLSAGDTILLCSDGLSDLVTLDETAHLVQSTGGDLDTAADALIARANEGGGRDNITVVLVRP